MIALQRLNNHQLSATKFITPQNVVEWMGAVQAQDYNMAKWAVGIRLPQITDKQIETAVNEAQILRLHILRPTWHFVSANDIYWMLNLSRPRVKMQIRSSDKVLELNETFLAKIYPSFEKMLQNHNYLTRQEIADNLVKEGCDMDTRRITHIMYHAELEGIVCNGVVGSKTQTYGLLEERVPVKRLLTKEESLEKLARKYFTSHAPVTLQDFVWWSGLTVGEAKTAVELIKHDFVMETVGNQTFYVNSDCDKQLLDDKIHLLPAYDEFIVSYKNRDDIFTSGNYEKVIHGFGLFKPAIAKNGHIIGAWRRVNKKKEVDVEINLFNKIDTQTQMLLDESIATFKAYCKG